MTIGRKWLQKMFIRFLNSPLRISSKFPVGQLRGPLLIHNVYFLLCSLRYVYYFYFDYVPFCTVNGQQCSCNIYHVTICTQQTIGNYVVATKAITRHSQVWHWYIHRSPLLKTSWWSSWCLQEAAGSHCGQHLSRWLPGALQSQIGSLQVTTPSLHMHLLQGLPAGARVTPFPTSRFSNQQPRQYATT